MSFGNCEICGAADWSEIYRGPVRDGVFGSRREQVTEHVSNPRAFLESIHPLLGSEGRLALSTPNGNDIPMALLPDDLWCSYLEHSGQADCIYMTLQPTAGKGRE